MAYNKIILKGDPIKKEYTLAAASTVYPGMLCLVNSDGNANVHATAGGTAAAMFALEDENLGGEIGTAYTAANEGLFGMFRKGDEVYALLLEDESVDEGDYVESAGNGYLRKVDTDTSAGTIGVQSVVGRVLVALDLSASATATLAAKRLHIEIV